jgi:hypothetical protein
VSKPVSISKVFGSIATTAQLGDLDTDFNALAASVNDTITYSNYYADTGTVNALAVTISAPLTFAWAAGVALDVLVANSSTVAAPTLAVNGVGQTIVGANGSALPPGALQAGTVYRFLFDGTNVRLAGITFATGTFTGTLTGFASNPSGTCSYAIVNGVATLTLPQGPLTGTSNSTAMSLTGVPAALRPATLQPTVALGGVIDTGNYYAGALNIVGGTFQFYAFIAGGLGFTASGTKGIGSGLTVTYPLQ